LLSSFPHQSLLKTNDSPKAEFIPKNVQTQEERVNLVFAVKIRLDNPDHRLKPGMPADAEILSDLYRLGNTPSSMTVVRVEHGDLPLTGAAGDTL